MCFRFGGLLGVGLALLAAAMIWLGGAIPPGPQIAFATQGDRIDESVIWLIQLDRKLMANLYYVDGRVDDLSWSPDGDLLYFSAWRLGEYTGRSIAVLDVENGEAEWLTGEGDDYAPDVSPDGRLLAFQYYGLEGNSEIRMIDMETQAVHVLYGGGRSSRTGRPDWSPDGKFIAFEVDFWSAGISDIVTLNLETEEVTRMTSGAGSEIMPDWSPDGESLAFVSFRNGEYNLYTRMIGEDEIHPLYTSVHRDTNPVWSPDGESLAFVSIRSEDGLPRIYVLEDGLPRLISPHAVTSTTPVWRPPR